MLKIVVLDGYTVNPGDLSWDALKALGECEIYDRTPPEKTIERCLDAEIILTNKVLIDQEVLKSLPKLRYIGIFATGYNVVDVATAHKQDVTLCNVPAYSSPSVAQMTFALLLELTNNVAIHAGSVKGGDWSICPDFSYCKLPLIELDGLTMGIVGFGGIGRAVAKLADAFGMHLLVHTRHPEKYQKSYPDITFLELDAIFAKSDVVTIHCPLDDTNEKFVNSEKMRMMKQSAFLINTSRGALIDEQALADALNEERISGAALDVLSTEPSSPDNPLLRAKNCLITPHIAWASKAARKRLFETATANVEAFLNHAPQNVIRG